MRKILCFLRTEQFESEGRGKGPIFEEGQRYEFDGDFADRWLRRGAAELVEEIPEVLDSADADQVAEIQAALEQRLDRSLQLMADDLLAARLPLQGALG